MTLVSRASASSGWTTPRPSGHGGCKRDSLTGSCGWGYPGKYWLSTPGKRTGVRTPTGRRFMPESAHSSCADALGTSVCRCIAQAHRRRRSRRGGRAFPHTHFSFSRRVSSFTAEQQEALRAVPRNLLLLEMNCSISWLGQQGKVMNYLKIVATQMLGKERGRR